ncbi:MAG: RHS repeat-associated core domain-containing protein [Verrucomicrobiae bacterium]|nr:RHS repeat-associated core domain-containing protein [Verrucomicrobiae bacterium]
MQKFVYDGWLQVQELDGNNNVVRHYTRGLDLAQSFDSTGGVGSLLAITLPATSAQSAGVTGSAYYVYDGNGNVMNLIDSANQTVATYEYDPFGRKLLSTGTLASQPFQFSSKEFSEVTGLNYYGLRFYNPQTGRWLSRDPIAESGGINLYGYCLNDPVNFVDPWGTKPGEPYTTPDAAAMAAANDMYEDSYNNDWEYIANIYQDKDGKYSYTEPKTQENPHSSSLSKKNIPQGTSYNSNIHSHGAPSEGYNDEEFSGSPDDPCDRSTDKAVSDTRGSSGYLVTPSGKVKKYTPNGSYRAGTVTTIGTVNNPKSTPRNGPQPTSGKGNRGTKI